MRTARVPVGVLILTGALGAPGPRPPLPAAVREVITTHCAGWQFAPVDSARVRGWRPGDRPDWVSGDFDGDGRRDYAVQIMCPTGKMTPVERLALLARGTTYQLFVLAIVPATEAYFFHVSSEPGYPPELSAVMDEERSLLYQWKGDHFEEVLLGKD